MYQNNLGYGYEAYPNTTGFGISIISRHWFEGLLASGPCRVIDYLERGWDNHQDVLFVKKRKFGDVPLSYFA
jgi:hypothetical protein